MQLFKLKIFHGIFIEVIKSKTCERKSYKLYILYQQRTRLYWLKLGLFYPIFIESQTKVIKIKHKSRKIRILISISESLWIHSRTLLMDVSENRYVCLKSTAQKEKHIDKKIKYSGCTWEWSIEFPHKGNKNRRRSRNRSRKKWKL